MILGTGQVGVDLCRQILRRSDLNFDVVGFLAEDAQRVGEKLVNPGILGTVQELEKAPKKVFNLFSQMPSNNKIVLKINDESIQLANSYITEDILTPKFFNDAIHIALATISKVDVLISWNFKHIVNYHKILLFNSVNLKKLYSKIEIRSPLELLNE